jgi:hypothetical protein
MEAILAAVPDVTRRPVENAESICLANPERAGNDR